MEKPLIEIEINWYL